MASMLEKFRNAVVVRQRDDAASKLMSLASNDTERNDARRAVRAG